MKLKKVMISVITASLIFTSLAVNVLAESKIKIDAAHFPDSYLRKYIKENSNINPNYDDYLTATEIRNVTELRIGGCGDISQNMPGDRIVDLTGIEIFTNVNHLELTRLASLKSVDISVFPNIQYCWIFDTKINKINITEANVNLDSIWLRDNPNLKSLCLVDIPALKCIRIENCPIALVYLGNCPLGEAWNLGSNSETFGPDNYFTRDDFFMAWDNDNLEVIGANDDWFELSAANIPNATLRNYLRDTFDGDFNGALSPFDIFFANDIDVSNMGLTSLDVLDKLTNITTLNASSNPLTSINLRNRPQLTSLNLSWTNISTLDISNNSNLKNLLLYKTNIRNLNISGNPELIDIYQNGTESVFGADHSMFPDMICYDRLEDGSERLMIDSSCTVATTTGATLPSFTPTSDKTGLEGFVERLYSVVLGRNGDAAGKEYWMSNLLAQSITGGDAARSFVLSEEFTSKGYTNEQFVEVLYRLFFNRTGEDDPAGYAFWLNCLNNGQSRVDVISGFVNSNEWANLCASYGISSGGIGIPQYPSSITNFATRLYTTCLNREADASGVEYWTIQLFSGAATGSAVAHSYFFGEEFTSQQVSDSEYVSRLYRTFLNREGSTEDIAYWVEITGTNGRETVFNGFVVSDEFGVICSEAGIAR